MISRPSFQLAILVKKQLHKCKNKIKIKFRVLVSSFHTYLLSGIEPLAGRRQGATDLCWYLVQAWKLGRWHSHYRAMPLPACQVRHTQGSWKREVVTWLKAAQYLHNTESLPQKTPSAFLFSNDELHTGFHNDSLRRLPTRRPPFPLDLSPRSCLDILKTCPWRQRGSWLFMKRCGKLHAH